MTEDIVGFVIDSDELAGQGGFLAIRRLRMREKIGILCLKPCQVPSGRPYP